MIAFFFSAVCPDGWAELTEAQGRAIIGLPSGATNAHTHGTALNGDSPASVSLTHTHSASSSTFTPATVNPGASGTNVPSASTASHSHTITVDSASPSLSTGDIIPTIQVCLYNFSLIQELVLLEIFDGLIRYLCVCLSLCFGYYL